MFELLSFIFGGAFRLAPEIMKMLDKKNERSHELKMMDKQREADEARSKLAMQQMELQGKIALDIEELKALVAASQSQMAAPVHLTGKFWIDVISIIVDALNKAVRPLVTYWYCVVAYGSYKTALLIKMFQDDVLWSDAVIALWTKEDHAVMFSILGFWFVDRSLRYMGR